MVARIEVTNIKPEKVSSAKGWQTRSDKDKGLFHKSCNELFDQLHCLVSFEEVASTLIRGTAHFNSRSNNSRIGIYSEHEVSIHTLKKRIRRLSGDAKLDVVK